MAKANPFMEMIAKKKAMAKGPAKKMAAGGIAASKMGRLRPQLLAKMALLLKARPKVR